MTGSEGHGISFEQHANGSREAHQQLQDKEELAEQTHQEGFIGAADDSPAVLKTEYPPKLEPHLEQPAKAQQDTPDGEAISSAILDALGLSSKHAAGYSTSFRFLGL